MVLKYWEENINRVYDRQQNNARTLSNFGLSTATKKGAGLPEMITGTTVASLQFEYIFRQKVINLGKKLKKIKLARTILKVW